MTLNFNDTAVNFQQNFLFPRLLYDNKTVYVKEIYMELNISRSETNTHRNVK